MQHRNWLFALTALVLAGSLSAQGPTADGDILVTGEREPPTREAVAQMARHISIIGDPLHNPLPRFQDALCPGVLGLTGDAAAMVIDRIRYNAEQLDLSIAKGDGECEPNLIVAFLEDAQGQLVELARRRGYMLAGLSVTERGDLLDAPGAARVWTNTLTRTRDGMPVQGQREASAAPERVGSTLAGTSGSGQEVSAQSGMRLPPIAYTQAAQSRMFFPTREDIVSVMVLFDREQVKGKTLIQLADYATMRGLAFTRETQGQMATDTILGLFDGEGPKPGQLTSFDHAYLSSVYDGLANIPAASKLLSVADEMEKARAAP